MTDLVLRAIKIKLGMISCQFNDLIHRHFNIVRAWKVDCRAIGRTPLHCTGLLLCRLITSNYEV